MSMSDLSPTDSVRTEPPAKARHGGVARAVAAFVLIFVGVICLVLAPLTIWGRNLILNTDRYVATLKPIAGNAGVQDAVIAAVDRRVTENIDVTSLVQTSLPPRARVLAGPLQSGLSSLVNTVTTQFVRSDAFQTLWVVINRTAHEQIDYALTGDLPPGAAVHVDNNGQILLDLSSVVTKVKDKLVAAGLTVASQVPAVGTTIEIANVEGLTHARTAVRKLNTLADWLPWVGLGLIAAGAAVARRHRRAVVWSAGGLAAGMVLIGIGLLVARHLYVQAIPPDKLPSDTAKYLFDTLVRFLRLGMRLVLLFAVLVMLTVWLTGHSERATAVRAAARKAPTVSAEWVASSRLGPFTVRNIKAIRIGIVSVGFITLILWTNPSLATIISLAVIVAVLLSAVELVRGATRHRIRPA
jgi:hypothetical protein